MARLDWKRALSTLKFSIPTAGIVALLTSADTHFRFSVGSAPTWFQYAILETFWAKFLFDFMLFGSVFIVPMFLFGLLTKPKKHRKEFLIGKFAKKGSKLDKANKMDGTGIRNIDYDTGFLFSVIIVFLVSLYLIFEAVLPQRGLIYYAIIPTIGLATTFLLRRKLKGFIEKLNEKQKTRLTYAKIIIAVLIFLFWIYVVYLR